MLIFDTKNPYATTIVLGSLVVFLFMFWGYSQIFTTMAKQVDVGEQLKKWNETLPHSYKFTVISGCMFLITSKVTVKNGKHTFSLDTEKITLVELFKVAKKVKEQAYKSEINYDEKYGFPTHIDIDWSRDTIGDECFYEVTEFEVIEL